MSRVKEFAPELSDAMLVEGYGKVLSRTNIDVRMRELCVVVILALKHRLRQLLSHALGCLRLGVTEDQLRFAVSFALKETPPEKANLVLLTVQHAVDSISKS